MDSSSQESTTAGEALAETTERSAAGLLADTAMVVLDGSAGLFLIGVALALGHQIATGALSADFVSFALTTAIAWAGLRTVWRAGVRHTHTQER